MKIKNLKKKLNGELPVTKEELIKLIDSWGIEGSFSRVESKEGYDLSRLDISQITDMSKIFEYSLFNGDISKWDTSNVTNMKDMFWRAKNFNQPLPWDTSKVIDMRRMFYEAISFNQVINFDTSSVINDSYMLFLAENFLNKYNSGMEIDNPKDWLIENRDKMLILSISKEDKDSLDEFFNNIHSSNGVGLHENIENKNNISINKDN